MNSSVYYFARQPILDADENIIAYELLYRNSATQSALTHTPQHATAEVLVNTLSRNDLQTIIGKRHKAFINIDEPMLFNEILFSLPKDTIILELLETITINERVIERVKSMHQAGFHFALDDVECSKDICLEISPILPYIDIIKLETPAEHPDDKKYISLFKKAHCKVLAEKIETHQRFNHYKELGCDYFQGYYFAKPTIMSSEAIDPCITLILKSVTILTTTKDLESVITLLNQDAAIALQLLRFINSAAFSLKSDIHSIRHAVMMLGTTKLTQWLVLTSYAITHSRGIHSPLLQLAQQRANIMGELASLSLDFKMIEEAVLIGLLSLVDVLLKRPMAEILRELKVDDIIMNSITKREGELGILLQLAQLSEEANYDAIEALLPQLSLTSIQFYEAVERAYIKSETFMQTLTN